MPERDLLSRSAVLKAEDSAGEKFRREVDLLFGGSKMGVAHSLEDAYNHPGTTLAKLGGAAAVGASLSLMQGRGGMYKIGSELVGMAFSYAFLTDVAGRASLMSNAISDTWHSADRLDWNKQTVAQTVGPLVIDGALMSAAGIAGARVSRIPAVNEALYTGIDNLYSRVPSPVSLREARLLKELDSYHADFGQHSRRVEKYANLIAEEMGLPRSTRVVIGHAAIMHDIGKLDTPMAILDKPGKLTPDELAVMQTHPARTFDRLSALAYPERFGDVPMIAAAHHEKLNGLGYPRGLPSSEIPLEARILSAADTFDAMTSARAYQSRLPLSKVLANLNESKGAQLDSGVVEALLRLPADKVARILESAPGEPVLPDLRPLKPATLGQVLEADGNGAAAGLNSSASDLFASIYKH